MMRRYSEKYFENKMMTQRVAIAFRTVGAHLSMIAALSTALFGCSDEICHMFQGLTFAVVTTCDEPVVLSPNMPASARFRLVGADDDDWLPCVFNADLPLENDVALCTVERGHPSLSCGFTSFAGFQGVAPKTTDWDFEVEVSVGEFFGKKVFRSGVSRDEACIPTGLQTTLKFERK